MIFWTRRYVAHLEAEIDLWRTLAAHERARAERAIDTLLAVQAHVPPVSPPEVAETDRAIAALQLNPEFAAVGNPEGVA